MTITYVFEDKLYLNITNRCTNACDFCVRTHNDGFYSDDPLWLEREPTADEIIADIFSHDLTAYTELVFCGYGEPTCAYDNLLQAAAYLKEKGLKLRLNTNGLSDLLNKKPTAKELCKYFDTISISLNAPTAEKYNELCKPSFGEKSFDALLQFARDCKETGVNLKFSLVDVIPQEDIAACQALSDRMGIPLRVREYVAD